jgi:putative hydrolases of HD superfamily
MDTIGCGPSSAIPNGGGACARRLERQIQFILEVDRLKNVIRRSYLVNRQRHENSAEHSWHLTVLALVLAEHAVEAVDLARVLKMLVIHDLVEVDAGDTYIYDVEANREKAAREAEAAKRIFGLLPEDQALELRQLWEEFESRATADARFAAALDRFMPLLHNYHTQGKSWREHGVSSEQVLDRTQHIEEGSKVLWRLAQDLVADAVNRGYLAEAGSNQ